MEEEKVPRLENWSIFNVEDGDEFYLAAYGEVYNHPKHTDGYPVKIKRIKYLNSGKKVLKTKKKEFSLGEIDEEYREFLEDGDLNVNKLLILNGEQVPERKVN